MAFGGGDPTKTEGFDMARRKGNVEEYLRKYYREYMQSDWETGWTQDEEDDFVARYTNEYNQGGRVGFYAGTDEDGKDECVKRIGSCCNFECVGLGSSDKLNIGDICFQFESD